MLDYWEYHTQVPEPYTYPNPRRNPCRNPYPYAGNKPDVKSRVQELLQTFNGLFYYFLFFGHKKLEKILKIFSENL